MNPARLQLRDGGTARREAAAVLLPGAEPASWLRDLVAGQRELGRIELYPLLPTGLLAVGAGATRGLAFGWVGERLLVPLTAEIHPPVSAAEADRLWADWEVVLWHPTLGLSGFRRQDRWSLAELLAVPRTHPAGGWNDACPADPPSPSLRLIQLPLPVQTSELFGDAAREIGSEPVRPPAAPGNASGTSGSWLQALSGWFGGGGGGARGASASSSSPGWLNSLEGWLQRHLGPGAAGGAGEAPSNLSQLRQREIDRLLRELTDHPDRGLRRAIPLGSLPGSLPRGVAPPSWRLGLRQTDFALDALFTGGAADGWSLDAQRQNLLRQRYHELARREIQLGRHRRAAYIYAQLLRDLNGAALTLLQGGHHREAAVLFLDHLHNPSQAARALVEGGFYEEALPVLESIPDWRGLARVQRLRGDEAAARAALRREAQRLVEAGDRLTAANVLEGEVEDPRAAAAVLADGWPQGNQAGECLAELLVLHLRQHWKEEAEALLGGLRSAELTPPQEQVLTKVLARLHVRLPEAPWRRQLADVTYARLGRALPRTPEKDQRALLECLPKLAAGDRLVGRDVQRFLGFPRRPEVGSRLLRETVGSWRIEQLRTLPAPAPLELQAAATTRDGYVLVGHDAAGDVEARLTTWAGESTSVRWPDRRLHGAPLIVASPEHRTHIFLLSDSETGEAGLPMAQFPGSPVLIGRPTWLPPDTWEAAFLGGEVVSTRGLPEPTLSVHTVAGVLAGTSPLPTIDWRHSNVTHLAAHPGGMLVFAADEELHLLERGKLAGSGASAQVEFDLASRIERVRVSSRSARALFAVVTDRAVFLCGAGMREPIHVADTRAASPYLAAFTGSNCLVLVDDLGGQLFEIDLAGRPQLRAEFPLPPAVEVTAGPICDDFAIFGRDGSVQLFRNAR